MQYLLKYLLSEKSKKLVEEESSISHFLKCTVQRLFFNIFFFIIYIKSTKAPIEAFAAGLQQVYVDMNGGFWGAVRACSHLRCSLKSNPRLDCSSESTWQADGRRSIPSSPTALTPWTLHLHAATRRVACGCGVVEEQPHSLAESNRGHNSSRKARYCGMCMLLDAASAVKGGVVGGVE